MKNKIERKYKINKFNVLKQYKEKRKKNKIKKILYKR